jgi:hypothetical protein
MMVMMTMTMMLGRKLLGTRILGWNQGQEKSFCVSERLWES